MVLALAVTLIPPVSAEPQKVVFKRSWGYNPPPAGHWNIFAPGSISVASIVQESLTHYYPANGTYVPGLAVNWTYENYQVFTLKLRKGVKWHDGREFNASDIWAEWYCLYLQKDRSWYYLQNITIVDSHTLVFYMKERNDYCPFYILWHYVAVPAKDYGDIASRTYAKIQEGNDIIANATPFSDLVNDLKNLRPSAPIGTGPYKFTSISETEIVLEKNPDYWNRPPDIDEVRLVRVTATDVLWRMLSEGEFDFHWALPSKEQHELLVGKPWVRIVGVPRPNGAAIYINSRVYPLSLQEVRQAVAYAINRTEIGYIQYPAGATATSYNVGFTDAQLSVVLNQTFIDRWIANYTYSYNPAKAEQILKNLGFTKGSDGVYVTPNGTKLEFEMKSSGWLTGEAMDAVSSQLSLVGIKVTPRLIDAATFTAADGDFYQGRYDFGVMVFDGADFSFDEFYHKYLYLYPGHGMPLFQSVPWLTEPVNVTYLTKYMQTYPAKCTAPERDAIRSTLAYITASQVPVLCVASPTAYMYLNTRTFSGWPASDDLYWRGLGSYEAHGSSYLHRWLLLKPNLNLTVSVTPSGGGTTSPSAGTLTYAKGQKVTVMATPTTGFSFTGWKLNGNPVSGATISFTLNATSTLEAVFEAMQGLTISITPSGGGTTSPAPGTTSYAKGQSVTVTATPASGYNFVGWKLDGTQVSGATITVTMATSHTLEAIFERIPIELYAGGAVAVIIVVAIVVLVMRRKPKTG